MALTKDRIPNNTQMGLVQAYTYYGNVFGGSSAQVNSDQSYQPAEGGAQSVINFKTTTAGYNNIIHSNGSSFLSFDQNPDHHHHQNSNPNKISDDQQLDDDYSIWEDNLIQDFSTTRVQSTSFYGADQPFGWPNSEENPNCGNNFPEEFGKQEEGFNKRPHKGESNQAIKKQCTNATKKAKQKSTTPSKDPQSVAAKNRRERISERLKVLQDLVPNGSKVDLVTMLEKAISYVKFLQLQVKVLATDEFWPVQGGKAPDISQVKEAIDAILSSQKEKNSSLE
ncbi:hypothetical protein RHSIM_Rhsim08G0086300 [Rhododendron simsii]|uniref:BHLH domain-containing protein n=1 Tax=Rhododendron simsii TaxID=118357 RepID=A0A834GMB9_RHOSS|nr:hypothetical protein RHSIM_Rhsim08G0086300 [Rhododendron simsii]